MTLKEFKLWLQGYLDGKGSFPLSDTQVELIIKKLKEVTEQAERVTVRPASVSPGGYCYLPITTNPWDSTFDQAHETIPPWPTIIVANSDAPLEPPLPVVITRLLTGEASI